MYSAPSSSLGFMAIAKYIYGYINSDKNSEVSKKFKFKNKNFYSHNDGIAFFDDDKTTCQIDVLKGEVFNELKGKAIIKCKNKEIFSADINFENDGNTGKGYQVFYKGGQSGELEFFDTLPTTVVKFMDYKSNSAARTVLAKKSKEKKETNENLDLDVTGKYYALLIGNSDYEAKGKYADLISPKNDVTKLAKVLESKYNFEVITGVDVTRDEFFDKIDELKNVVTDNDYVLIYYSGHGEKVENERYWIPVNGSKNNRRNWFNVDDLTSSFVGINPEIPSTHLALLVDSCWFAVKGSDTIKNKKLSFSKLLKSRAAIVMASGNDEYVDEPGKGNSDFAKIIISELENSNSPIRLHNIYMKVSEETGGLDQNPFYRPMNIWNHKNGDFIFIPKS